MAVLREGPGHPLDLLAPLELHGLLTYAFFAAATAPAKQEAAIQRPRTPVSHPSP
ncbi:hypothetical protein ACQEVG_18690 [Streptomyces sp. CA-135486]|uniref:hypothetical protein n=1 Tax=Streptomyces sp. CA-135486 TaxID=3240049 RepID=UPI003D905D1C